MKTTGASKAKLQGPRDMILEFRRKHAKSLQKISIREINQMKEAGRR